MRFSRLVVAFVLLLVPAAAFSEPLTTEDREKLLEHLEKTQDVFLASVDGLSDAQWNYRAAEGRWTIAEVAEHITAAESLLRGTAEGAMKEPAAEMPEDARGDEFVLKVIPDRSKKFQAPEPLQPTNRYGSPAATLEEFRNQRATTIDLAKNGGDLRAYAAKGPTGKPLDAYGWILFTSAHTERHTKQIEEVKADPGFPKE
ncbi:MAG: DinB family protein [Thermoanaerobaculia bacterium]